MSESSGGPSGPQEHSVNTEVPHPPKPEQIAYDRLHDGLRHGPVRADWDPATALWSHSPWAEFGVLEGWLWGTDTATALVERSVETHDSPWHPELGHKVLELAQRELAGPIYTAQVLDLALIGGHGRLQELGDFDLDRVRDAAMWVAGPSADETDRIEISAADSETGFPLIRLVRWVPLERYAVVCGVKRQSDWLPDIDLPLHLEIGAIDDY